MPQPQQVPEQNDRVAGGSRDLPGRLRQDILSSWKRSLLAGLAPERFEVPHVTDVDEDGPLAWTAAPVMARLAEDLDGTGIGILLADSRGHIISRRSGERQVLFLSPHTIDFHLRQIYRRLGVRSRVELARLAGPPPANALAGPAALPITAAQRDATLQGLGWARPFRRLGPGRHVAADYAPS